MTSYSQLELSPLQLAEVRDKTEVWILREDLLPFAFGGNKVRIAQRYIEDMRTKGKTVMIGYGSSRSNLSRVLTALCSQQKIPCSIISATDEGNMLGEAESKSFNQQLVDILGTKVFSCSKEQVAKTIPAVKKFFCDQGDLPYFIYDPENMPAAVSAYADLVPQLLAWERTKQLHFDEIFLACGTGTTLAGLLCGFYRAGDKRKIWGVSVARDKAREIKVLSEDVRLWCESQKLDVFLPQEDCILDEYLCGGYGRYDDRVENVITDLYIRRGIPLDPCYTGKAYWGMRQQLKEKCNGNKRVLFIHTGGTPLFFDFLQKKSKEKLQIVHLEDNEENRLKLKNFLQKNSAEFAQPLDGRIDIALYTEKILSKGYVFAGMQAGAIRGVVCGYANNHFEKVAYESIFVVDKKVRGSGLARQLFEMQLVYCREQSMKTLRFNTSRGNAAAIEFYKKYSVPIDPKTCSSEKIGYEMNLE